VKYIVNNGENYELSKQMARSCGTNLGTSIPRTILHALLEEKRNTKE